MKSPNAEMLEQKLNCPGINLKAAIEKASRKGLGAIFKPEPQKLSDWAEDNFYLSPESSSTVGPWETLPYQKGIMNIISNDDVEIITWMKSARVGYTKIITAALAFFSEHKQRNQAVYQPTDDDRDAYVKDEVDPMLRDVPVLKSIFPWYGVKHKNNTLEKKKFIGSTLHLLGGKSPRNYRRITVDVVYYDELSGFDSNVGGEGAATTLGDTRNETSNFPKSIRGSTPKIKGTCQIESSLKDADVVLHFFVPCPHCDAMQRLEWGGKDAEFGFKWTGDDAETAKYQCKHCQELFDYSCLSSISEKGQWQTDDGSVYLDEDDQFRNERHKLIDAPNHVGICIWSAYSFFKTWSALVGDFIKANRKAKEGEIGPLISFVNTKLGDTWEESEGSELDHDTLYKRREPYPVKSKKIVAPNSVLYITVGIDTQDDRFEWEVVGWGLGEESWSLGYHSLYGDLTQPQIWNILAEMVNKPIEREDGTILEVGKIGHDSGGHFTKDVYEFSKKLGIYHLIPMKGSSSYGKPIADFPKKKHRKYGVYLAEIDTNAAKDVIYPRLNIQSDNLNESRPGYCHFPIAETHDEAFFKMLTAERKILKFSRGKRVYVYECPKGKRNEALDCRVYALAALRLAQQRFGVDLDQLANVSKADEGPDFSAIGRRR
jgi:phage terminase large subunit GpA-like protein